MGAFATDSDKPRRHGPPGGAPRVGLRSRGASPRGRARRDAGRGGTTESTPPGGGRRGPRRRPRTGTPPASRREKLTTPHGSGPSPHRSPGKASRRPLNNLPGNDDDAPPVDCAGAAPQPRSGLPARALPRGLGPPEAGARRGGRRPPRPDPHPGRARERLHRRAPHPQLGAAGLRRRRGRARHRRRPRREDHLARPGAADRLPDRAPGPPHRRHQVRARPGGRRHGGVRRLRGGHSARGGPFGGVGTRRPRRPRWPRQSPSARTPPGGADGGGEAPRPPGVRIPER